MTTEQRYKVLLGLRLAVVVAALVLLITAPGIISSVTMLTALAAAADPLLFKKRYQ